MAETTNPERTMGEKVCRAIRAGRCDAELTDIAATLGIRIRYVQSKQAMENLLKLDIGDLVRINDNVKPKYLAGQRCKVVEVSDRRRAGIPMLVIQLPPHGNWGKFRTGRLLTSAGSVTLLKKADET
jgi:hypothetical protein